jgi:hypothetical protein
MCRGHGRDKTVTHAPNSTPLPVDIDLTKPSVARVYDYLLDGTTNWAIDREFARRMVERYPLVKRIAQANRLFLDRVVRYLMGTGVRQFVDIGSGVPTMGNTHQAADSIAPDSRVVYIDHDPMAVTHSRALLAEHGDTRRHAVVNADLRDPEHLWNEVARTGVIDVDQPVGLMIIAVLHVQQLDENGRDIGPQCVAQYRDLLPHGSYLAISHATDDRVPDGIDRTLADIKTMYDSHSSPVIWRNHHDVRALFGDFSLVEPGMVWTPQWHPECANPDITPVEFSAPNESVIWAGVGRKS